MGKKELTTEEDIRQYMLTGIKNVLSKEITPERINVLWVLSEVFKNHKANIDKEVLRLLKEDSNAFKHLTIAKTQTKRAVKKLTKEQLDLMKELGYKKELLTQETMQSIGKLEKVLKEEHRKLFINEAGIGKDIIKEK